MLSEALGSVDNGVLFATQRTSGQSNQTEGACTSGEKNIAEIYFLVRINVPSGYGNEPELQKNRVNVKGSIDFQPFLANISKNAEETN